MLRIHRRKYNIQYNITRGESAKYLYEWQLNRYVFRSILYKTTSTVVAQRVHRIDQDSSRESFPLFITYSRVHVQLYVYISLNYIYIFMQVFFTISTRFLERWHIENVPNILRRSPGSSFFFVLYIYFFYLRHYNYPCSVNKRELIFVCVFFLNFLLVSMAVERKGREWSFPYLFSVHCFLIIFFTVSINLVHKVYSCF